MQDNKIDIVVYYSVCYYENVGTVVAPKWQYCAEAQYRFYVQADIETLLHRFNKLEERISKRVMEKTAEVAAQYADAFNKIEYNSHEIFHADLQDEQVEYETI